MNWPQGVASHISYQLFRNYDHATPETMEEWKEKHAILVKKKREIEAMLSDKNILADDGERMNHKAYNKRRTELIKIKFEIENQIIELKNMKSKLFSRQVKEKDILNGNDLHSTVLTALQDIAASIKNIQFLLHREWTDDGQED